jgi:hypothetical protein
MARVNAYLRASSDNGRTVSVGGRGASDRVSAWLNTDNRAGSADMSVKAEVIGRGMRAKDRRRKDTGDDRKSVFTVDLPEPSEAVEVYIRPAGAWASELIGMGAMLCGVKAAEQAIAGDSAGASATLASVADILRGHEESLANLPEVLPGGVTLRQALAAVATVKTLQERGGSVN